MKKVWLLWGLFLLAGTCFGQGVPYFSNVYTSANSAPPGSQTTMYTVPFSTVTVCGAIPVGNPCTNTVVIYANAGMTVTAHNPITTDVHGKFNFWAPAGTYSYSLKSASGTLLGTYYFTLGGSGGGSSVSLQHNGTALANQNVLNFNDTTPAAPSGNVNVVFLTDSTGRISGYVPISASSFILTTTGTGPATYSSGTLNIPDYTYTLTVPKITALGTLTNDTSGSAAKIGGVAVSGTPGIGQLPVATGPGTASWQTVSATGGISGQTTNCLLKANSATTSNASAALCDLAGVLTATEPITVNDGTGNAGRLALTQGTAASTVANSISLTAPTSVTAYNIKLPAAQGTGALTNDGSGNMSWSASGGFPITIGSTSIAASSTTTAVTGLTVNSVTLDATGSSTLFLNKAGGYTAPSGAGTVSSVAQTVPSWLTVSGSPVTTTGTLAITAATGQTSHQVLGTCGTATSFAPCALNTSDLPSNTTVGTVGTVIDGAGSAPTTGAKGFIQVPYSGTITGWTLLGDASGSAQITVSKGTYSAYPTVSSIDASLPPNLSTAQKNTSTTLTGWTTSVTAGDVITFNLDSISGSITRLTLQLQIARN